jgi:hypothetical protein
LQKHVWTALVDDPSSVAAGGNGVEIRRVPRHAASASSNDQYLRHLSDDVLPIILRKAFEIASV